MKKDKGLIPKPWRSTSPKPTDYAGAPAISPKSKGKRNIQAGSVEGIAGGSDNAWWNPGSLK